MHLKKMILPFFSLCMLFMITGCYNANVSNQSNKGTSQSDSNAENLKGKKILIAYFSWSGNTRKVANQIHEKVGGDIFEIKTVEQYPTDHQSASEVAKKELDEHARPRLVSEVHNMADYDVVMIGYPIWWYTAPMAIDTFLESYDLSGKTIIPFCTSGGSEIEGSMPTIRELAGKAKVRDGLTLVNPDDLSKLDSWLKKQGLL